MQAYCRLMLLAMFVLANLFINSTLTTAEPIEPTRTLDGEPQPTTGRLTVLSEPPGMNITLDGDSLGETPAFLVEVDAGIHTLSVKDSKTDIYVEPGKTVKISLFKNEFILIPVEDKQLEQPKTDVQSQTRETTSRPRDPISTRAKQQRKQTQKRFQKVIDGSQPIPIF